MRSLLFVAAILFSTAASADFPIQVGGATDYSPGRQTSRILIAVEPTLGDVYGSGDYEVGDTHYFWVNGSVGIDGKHVPYFDMDIVPATEFTMLEADGRPGHWHAGAIRKLPIRISRDLDLGKDLAVSIHAFGYATDGEAPLIGADGSDSGDRKGLCEGARQGAEYAPCTPRLLVFARGAVDLVGLRYLYSRESVGNFMGADIMRFQAEVGLGWNVDTEAKIRLNFSLGADDDISYGFYGDGSTGAIHEWDLYARMEAVFGQILGGLTLYGQTGLSYLETETDLYERDYVRVGIELPVTGNAGGAFKRR